MTSRRALARPAAGPVSGGHFKTLAGTELAARLERFYLGLAFDGRRQRFKAGISDESIRRYCAAIDTGACFAVGLVQDGELRAVLEVHALGRTFASAELTVCCRPQVECFHVVAHFVQIAAFEAARRGCGRLVVDADDCTIVLLEILRQVGHRGPDGLTGFDISDYAAASDHDLIPVAFGERPERSGTSAVRATRTLSAEGGAASLYAQP